MQGAVSIVADGCAAVEFIPLDERQPLVWSELFARHGPVEVDLGCGDGSLLAALAEQHPERNFVGVERLVGRVRSACLKVALRGLTNARVLSVDIRDAVQQLLPAESVDWFHLLFPDPWPKRRHHRRRVVTAQFLDAIATALVTGGTFHVATDQADYFAQIVRLARGTPRLELTADDSFKPQPVTTFEKRFRAAGVEIHRLVLRKVSDSR